VKAGMVIAVAGAAVIAVGMSGCSSNKSTTSGSSSSSAGASTPASASAGASNAKVLIDGKDQNVGRAVSCVTAGGNINIGIGAQSAGVGAVLSDANPPQVKSVGLGKVNGVTLGYTAGTGQGNAQATKTGDSYTIKGTATGLDMANPMQPVNKPFEIDVTCQ
jgi:lipoprotein LpqH